MASMLSQTSESLLEGLRAGDRGAWHRLWQCYAPLIAAYARRAQLSDPDAADVVQETLIAVHRAFAEMTSPFDRTQGRFRHWLGGIVRHKIDDVRRQRARRVRSGGAAQIGPNIDLAELAAPPSNDVWDVEWQRNTLRRALEQVATEVEPVIFQAFWLYVIEDQPAEQVAKLLGVSRNAVYISKCRVLRRLHGAVAEITAAED